MSKHVAFLSVVAACLGAAALPGAAAAADYPDGGDRPFAFHDRYDVDGGRARVPYGEDLRPGEAYVDRRVPGPVVFDERDPGRRYARPYRYGEPGYRRPLVAERPVFDDDRPAVAFPRVDRPYGVDAGYGYGYRPASIARPEPALGGPAFDGGRGGPDVGCTVEEVQSTTPLGWRKIVTHRTCYRR